MIIVFYRVASYYSMRSLARGNARLIFSEICRIAEATMKGLILHTMMPFVDYAWSTKAVRRTISISTKMNYIFGRNF